VVTPVDKSVVSFGPTSRSPRRTLLVAACSACALLGTGVAADAAPAPRASTTGTVLRIHALLGSGHTSPYTGQDVSGVPGVVTDVTSSSFSLQDPHPIGRTPFKQAIEVYTGRAPTVAVGDDVIVAGEVEEYAPDADDTPSSLPIAEIGDPTVMIASTGNPLPAPVIIGERGVEPPAQDIFGRGHKSVDVTTVKTFAPLRRALDFYQGLDSTLVEVERPVAVQPTNDSAFAVAPDNSVGAGTRTKAGGLAETGPKAYNSRRLAVYPSSGVTAPIVDTGDHFQGPLEGIMSEYEGNPELDLTQSVTVVPDKLEPQVARPQGPRQLAVATYNLDNLSPDAPSSKFASLGQQIVGDLRSPDILAVQEIQDNDGATDDGVVSATVTLDDLVSAISAAGGPTYSWTEIDPVNDADGGEPGGNIRPVILYRTDRGLKLVSAPGGGSTVADAVTGTGSSTALAQSPGRIDPTNPAFASGSTLTDPGSGRTMPSSASRKPLVAQFTYRGHNLFVIDNHLDAKLPDDADFGRYQPPVDFSEIQRTAQATVIHGFVKDIERADPHADVITLGDLNDQQYSPTFKKLESGGALDDTLAHLPKAQQYDYDFDGDSETLSGLLVSPALDRYLARARPVHINADFAGQTSDHDPLLADFTFPKSR
jgi:predicted extracellular nuclease